MKASELNRALTMLIAAYPNATVTPQTVLVYERMLSDLEAADVAEVVIQHIATRKWFPTVSELREAVMEKRLALPSPTEEIESIAQTKKAKSELGKRALKICGGWWSYSTTHNPTEWQRRFCQTYDELVGQEKAQMTQVAVGKLLAMNPARLTR